MLRLPAVSSHLSWRASAWWRRWRFVYKLQAKNHARAAIDDDITIESGQVPSTTCLDMSRQ